MYCCRLNTFFSCNVILAQEITVESDNHTWKPKQNKKRAIPNKRRMLILINYFVICKILTCTEYHFVLLIELCGKQDWLLLGTTCLHHVFTCPYQFILCTCRLLHLHYYIYLHYSLIILSLLHTCLLQYYILYYYYNCCIILCLMS